MNNKRFYIRYIEKVIVDLNYKRVPDIDDISNSMLIKLPQITIRIIIIKFNAILRTEPHPTKWNVSLVTGKNHKKLEPYIQIRLQLVKTI